MVIDVCSKLNISEISVSSGLVVNGTHNPWSTTRPESTSSLRLNIQESHLTLLGR